MNSKQYQQLAARSPGIWWLREGGRWHRTFGARRRFRGVAGCQCAAARSYSNGLVVHDTVSADVLQPG